MHDLQTILAALHHRRRRATYAAVAMLTGKVARGVMRHKPKTWQNSWVVSSKTHLPTGYAPEQMHPQLQQNPAVLTTGPALNKWLAETETQPPPARATPATPPPKDS